MNIDGVDYGLVVHRSSVSIYRSTGTFLRVGSKEVLNPELDIHQQLLHLGFPVPRLLGQGVHNGSFYFLEESVGDATFGDIFDSEFTQNGRVLPPSFDEFLQVVRRYTKAQLLAASSIDPTTTFAQIVHHNNVADVLPYLAEPTHRAFGQAVTRLRVFPAVLTHGDFHAFNICPHGVIDFEQVTWGFAGFDIVGALVTPDLFPPEPDAYQFNRSQVTRYLSQIDALFSEFGYEAPMQYIDDFRICRMMSLVSGRRRPAPVLEWLDKRYERLLRKYLGTD